MTADRQDDAGVREFRLEGLSLLLVGGVLLVLLSGAFYAGRWYERQVHPGGRPAAAAGDEDPLASVARVSPEAEIDDEADFFDTTGGDETQLEPQREVPQRTADEPAPPGPADSAPEPKEAPASEAAARGFYVQVFAGRDHDAAEKLVDELTGKGLGVRLFTEREGRGALFKVRVGGYPTRDEARTAAESLKRDGYAGAWVTTVE